MFISNRTKIKIRIKWKNWNKVWSMMYEDIIYYKNYISYINYIYYIKEYINIAVNTC